jgi:LemA protein
MGSFFIFFIVLASILVFIAIVVMVVYNRLVVLRNRYTNAFSQIDVQLKRRYDLIPNLVESARAYLTHERSTLEAVIKARQTAAWARQSAAGDPKQTTALRSLELADQSLSGAMSTLLATFEQYPDLKANNTISDLTEDLRSTENRIGFARQAYNDAVMDYNQSREMFPAVLFSSIFGFSVAEHWQIQGNNAENPKLTF